MTHTPPPTLTRPRPCPHLSTPSGPTAREDETSLVFWVMDKHRHLRRARPFLHTHDATGVQSLCFLRSAFVVVGGCYSHEKQGAGGKSGAQGATAGAPTTSIA